MTCSPAQLAAARANGARSRGPVTPEGKAISRRNGLKHSLTGEGVVLPHEDAEEVERRIEALEAEMQPRSELARQMLPRIALMMLRLRRSAEHEAKAISFRMRHAGETFDEARRAEVDHLMSWIASEPATNARRLRKTPEGIERLIAAISGLRDDLARVGGFVWTFGHADQLHNLLGLRFGDLPVSRIRALTEAILGNFQHLRETEGARLESNDRRVWAIGELVDFMDAEIEKLKALLDNFDHASLDLDRAEAPARAMFDDSKEAILARKYEAASERALFRALREFRELQVEIPETNTEQEIGESQTEESGSLFPDSTESENAESDANSTVTEGTEPTSKKRPDLEKLARKWRRRPNTT